MIKEKCGHCGKMCVIIGAVIMPLLNDPVIDVCNDCMNHYKIMNNEHKFKESIWNK